MMKDPDLILNMKESNTNKEGQQHQQQSNNKKSGMETTTTTTIPKKSQQHHTNNNNNHHSSSSSSPTSSSPTQLSPVSPTIPNSPLSLINNNSHTKNSNNCSPSSSSSKLKLEEEKKPALAPARLSYKQLSTITTATNIDEIIAQFNLSNKISVLKCNNQIKELHTVLRDKETSHSDFKFYSDRLIRLLVEESLNQLPYSSQRVTTPADCEYDGIKYIKGVCGVSIMRSGEAMEKGLRECCRSIRIGKILIQSNDDDHKKSSVVYAKFPSDIISRKILLMYPITTSGSTVNLAIRTLKEHGVAENNILVLCLFATPHGLQTVSTLYPDIHILTSEIFPTVPTDFGQRYFGTE